MNKKSKITRECLMSWAGKSKFIWKYYLQTDSLKLRQNLWRLTVPGVLRFFYIVQIKEIQAFKGKSTFQYYGTTSLDCLTLIKVPLIPPLSIDFSVSNICSAYWLNYWHTLISKDASGFTSNTFLIRIQYWYQFL